MTFKLTFINLLRSMVGLAPIQPPYPYEQLRSAMKPIRKSRKEAPHDYH